MITVALSTTIGASSDRVWRALTDPSERVAWDERVLGEVASSRRPHLNRRKAENTAKKSEWRFVLGGIPLVMREEIVLAEARQRMTSRISIGSMHFDQSLTLHREDDVTGPRTRLSIKMVARNRIAVIGEVVERLDVQKIVIEYVDSTLRQVQKHCEADA